jgi:hypothetical protein
MRSERERRGRQGGRGVGGREREQENRERGREREMERREVEREKLLVGEWGGRAWLAPMTAARS